MKIRREFSENKNELQMTSMIDVVFLLLIFFIATFKIAAQEGDFGVRMPLAGGSGGAPETTDLPIKLRLTANPDGSLNQILINDTQSYESFDGVRQFVLQMTGGVLPDEDESGPEVEIDIDYNLRYAHVIEAFTAVTGYRQGNDIIPIVDKVKFAPPRRP